ncbi:MAG: YbaK/EbsC family protein [Caldilineaceae bacterium SB0670_bin_27]|uniref:YbaK/EbsC family protein n=1 Tax=Caldilineaceae bacterium SB0664_bin_27 TaxID=2605260 RepID=A0A6B0YXT1_9CHLR|nr:YbaK/EbsC family protein [Caldilineaceae bacterium SB0664_bin_27]MYJ76838.1 YbaK/EbsC family protein [Caldilineaceae bacterium SB0670_bin_27]
MLSQRQAARHLQGDSAMIRLRIPWCTGTFQPSNRCTAKMTGNPMRTPDDLQRFIDENGIEAQLLREIGDTPTVPAAAAALGVEPDRILKTLLFLAQKPGDREAPPAPFVVISHGERRVEKRPLADLHGVGIKRIKLASPDVVLQMLGYPAGGVPPFGHSTAVQALLDSSIADLDPGFVYAGGGDDRTMLQLTVEELTRVVQPQLIAMSV